MSCTALFSSLAFSTTVCRNFAKRPVSGSSNPSIIQPRTFPVASLKKASFRIDSGSVCGDRIISVTANWALMASAIVKVWSTNSLEPFFGCWPSVCLSSSDGTQYEGKNLLSRPWRIFHASSLALSRRMICLARLQRLALKSTSAGDGRPSAG